MGNFKSVTSWMNYLILQCWLWMKQVLAVHSVIWEGWVRNAVLGSAVLPCVEIGLNPGTACEQTASWTEPLVQSFLHEMHPTVCLTSTVWEVLLLAAPSCIYTYLPIPLITCCLVFTPKAHWWCVFVHTVILLRLKKRNK